MIVTISDINDNTPKFTNLPYVVPVPEVSPQFLKITEKVSFYNIASEASNVYILSGQNFMKNA